MADLHFKLILINSLYASDLILVNNLFCPTFTFELKLGIIFFSSYTLTKCYW